jgi:hypothetical protein
MDGSSKTGNPLTLRREISEPFWSKMRQINLEKIIRFPDVVV